MIVVLAEIFEFVTAAILMAVALANLKKLRYSKESGACGQTFSQFQYPIGSVGTNAAVGWRW
jgi:hypothetical protein